MLSPLGFLRLSCSLLIHCFVKRKRRRRGGVSRSDSEDEEPTNIRRTAITAAKTALAKAVIHVRPPKPVTRPCLTSILAYFIKKKSKTMETPDEIEEPIEIGTKERPIRNRKVSNKADGVCEVFRHNAHQNLEYALTQSELSFGSDESYYASSDGGSDAESIDFEMGSEFSPRTSGESFINRNGLNPTFYAVDRSDDEEVGHKGATAMRRLSSVVDLDDTFKNKVHTARHLLVNPEYGQRLQEDSDSEVEIETKLKTLKSAVEAGCVIQPESTALVNRNYIGHTLLNPTFGEMSISTDESDSEDDESQLSDIPVVMPVDNLMRLPMESEYRLDTTNATVCSTPHSMPILSLRGMARSDALDNMGTLTWRNLMFSQSIDSEPEGQEAQQSADLEIKWRKTLATDTDDLPPEEATEIVTLKPELEDVQFEGKHVDIKEGKPKMVKGITKTLVTPIRSLPTDLFEEIDIRRDQLKAKQQLSKDIPSTTLIAAGLKHTRWALRSISLMFNKSEAISDKQK